MPSALPPAGPSESGGRRAWVCPTWKQILAVPASPSFGSSPTRLRKAARCVSVLTSNSILESCIACRTCVGLQPWVNGLAALGGRGCSLGWVGLQPWVGGIAALGGWGCSLELGLGELHRVASRGIVWHRLASRGIWWRACASSLDDW